MPGVEIGRALVILAFVGIITIAVVLNSEGVPADPGTGSGTLTVNVSLGPLCPVEPCTVSPDRLVAPYSAYPITVSGPGGTVIVSETANPDTGYTIFLKPGTYVVDIPHPKTGGSRDLPKTVTIRSGETVRLDIAIDTGIR